MKLNLGAGNLILKGYINHDIVKHRPEIDAICDLNYHDWCTAGRLLDVSNLHKFDWLNEIRAWDVLEHLDDPINFMDNCWRMLKKDGILDLKVCGYQNESYWIDPTHKKGYHIRSFDYFVPDTVLGKEYNYYTDKKWRYYDLPTYDRKGNVLVKLTPIK